MNFLIFSELELSSSAQFQFSEERRPRRSLLQRDSEANLKRFRSASSDSSLSSLSSDSDRPPSLQRFQPLLSLQRDSSLSSLSSDSSLSSLSSDSSLSSLSSAIPASLSLV
ncbi:hypothetical protein FCM35_KLT16822 [Carex littledalei]|uniref:Uncharacterized protein n=1 Tax=Carex littledalei TaxID=544730 RepID=A0A833RP75_9POAL|nr:hypothetical protein FCM35_KLT16822 [Carex littledalei]